MEVHAHPLNRANRLKGLENLIARLNRRGQQLEVVSNKYWLARRIVFLGGAVFSLSLCSYSGGARAVVLAVAFLAAFAVIAAFHRKVQDSITANLLMIDIKQVQIARIRLEWDRLPQLSEATPSATRHPFETDLDITGNRSLHQLLDCAVTRGGSERLKTWLLNPTPEARLIEERQSLVGELTTHSLFRDKLQLVSAVSSNEGRLKRPRPAVNEAGRWRHERQWDSNKLIGWIKSGVRKESLRPIVMLLAALAALNLALVVLAIFEVVPHVWPVAFLVYAGVMIAKQSRTATAWEELQELEKTLRRFRAIFEYLECRKYKSTPGLAAICSPFLDTAKRPSAELKRLERLAAALGLRTNAMLWFVIHALVPWDFYFTHRLHQLREELAELLPVWLNAWYELEALNSLANFAYLNPGYVFPDISSASPVVAARALGHPLLKPDARVCNDFELNGNTEIAILTGSNMAGKSTFLRTVGVNLCLAYAGAPVNAEALQVSLFRVFTCIKVSDSVQDGLSYFYAEVKRLKALLSAADEPAGPPLLFLIDEIFRGTNSRERLIGARAFIRGLSERRTIGLIATHDLELVKLADEIAHVSNFHFREEVRDGKMVFDYRLRPGPCPTTNALDIMRLEGLPVE